jgi:hypothetical protein
MIPAKWYVVIMLIFGVIALLLGISDRSRSECLWSLLPFVMATLTYFVYIRH